MASQIAYNPVDTSADQKLLDQYNQYLKTSSGTSGGTMLTSKNMFGTMADPFGYNGTYSGLVEARNNLANKLGTENSENKAQKTAFDKYTGDVGDFESMIPGYRGQALGNVVSRGLQGSFDPNSQSQTTGALGSQVMNKFNQGVGDTLGSMADSYGQYAGNLDLQSKARANAMQKFMMDQQYGNAVSQQDQGGLASFLAPIAAGLSFL
jgi:hypothetical protein